MNITRNTASFRDPSGFVFQYQDKLFRQVNQSYKQDYDFLMQSGLYKKLVNEKLLVPHKEVTLSGQTSDVYKTIRPEVIPFISYPYEWSFSQLQDAALLTLQIQKIALDFGMTLKDANGFNIQFLHGRPILIDTLSFETYQKDQPWVAYKQFCEQFLVPLTLASDRDISMIRLLSVFPDGIPLDVADKLLTLNAKLHPGAFLHVVMHNRSQKKYADVALKGTERHSEFSLQSLRGLIDSLEGAVGKLTWKPQGTTWGSYYQETDRPSYSQHGFDQKQKIVANYLGKIKIKTLLDLGANSGLYSRLAAKKGIFSLAVDSDPVAVETNYQQVKKDQEDNILPLWLDLTNPSPALGWENTERGSFWSRWQGDTILALALVHHLAIGHNLPLLILAEFFAAHCQNLIIEFVPKTDKQVKRLLQSREDIFPDYNQEAFDKEFSRYFNIKEVRKVVDSERIIYLMTRKKL